MILSSLYVSGCTKANLPLNTSSADSLDPGIVNQAPKPSCRITTGASNTFVRTVSLFTSRDSFGNAPIIEGSNVSVDCSATQDEAGASALSFKLNNSGAASSMNNAKASLVAGPAGSYPMSVTVTDPAGASSTVYFTVFSECATGNAPVINPSAISATPVAGFLNFFNYSAAGAVSGGRPPYKYAWDFNGDGAMDPYSIQNPLIWNDTASPSNVYSIYANHRNVKLTVLDSCNFVSSATVNLNFPIDNIPRAPGQALADSYPYYFLQADIRGVSNDSRSDDYIATQYPNPPDMPSPKRVQCSYDYNQGGASGFSISGLNTYDDGTNPSLVHGMSFDVSGIMDNGGSTKQTFSHSAGSSSNPKLNSGVYQTAEDPDVKPREHFGQNADCALTINVQHLQGAVPCSSGSGAQIQAATRISGSFDCPNLLEGSSPKAVAAHNGYFYCEVGPIDQCVGGGQGGGGVPPIPR